MLRNTILKLLLLFIPMLAVAQTRNTDVVYLNNGNVVEGVIIESVPDVSIRIRALNGNEYDYKMIEIRKIDTKLIVPEESQRAAYVHHDDLEKGYWYAVEGSYGHAVFRSNSDGYAQLSFTNGYRLNEYLRVGGGFGARWYVVNNSCRHASNDWSFPIYVNARGNVISQNVLRVVPFWSFDTGVAINDGFFFSPTFGVRLGGKRSNLLLALSYLGQNMKFDYMTTGQTIAKETEYVNFLSFKIGYEF